MKSTPGSGCVGIWDFLAAPVVTAGGGSGRPGGISSPPSLKTHNRLDIRASHYVDSADKTLQTFMALQDVNTILKPFRKLKNVKGGKMNIPAKEALP